MDTNKIIKDNGHYPQLDSIRGIAIIMVLCFHYFPNSKICNFGWTGVDLFFVLSGFLISSRLLPFLNDKKLLQRFYWNRALRIMPLYFGFITVFFICWFTLVSKDVLATYPFYNTHWWEFFIFLQNWVFIKNYPPSAVHLNHLWSIATEEQFYLVFPIFVLLIKQRKKLFFATLTLILIVASYRWMYFSTFIKNNEYQKIYWNTLFRMDSFLVGCALFLLLERRFNLPNIEKYVKYIFAFLLAILAFSIVLSKTADKSADFYTTYGYTLVAVIYAYFIYIALLNKYSIVNVLTRNRFLRYTGKISYGIYIFHWPVYMAGFVVFNKLSTKYHLTNFDSWIGLTNAIGCIFVTYFISYLSFRYFESKFLKLKSHSH